MGPERARAEVRHLNGRSRTARTLRRSHGKISQLLPPVRAKIRPVLPMPVPMIARVCCSRSTIMRTLTWCLAWSLSVVVAPAAMAQDRGLAIEHTVKVADIPGQLFHVTTDIKNINQPALDLSLPVWSPGWYVIENYAKNVLRFRVTEPGGRELRPAQVRKQTWRIDTSGI